MSLAGVLAGYLHKEPSVYLIVSRMSNKDLQDGLIKCIKNDCANCQFKHVIDETGCKGNRVMKTRIYKAKG